MGGDPEGIDPVAAVVEMLHPLLARHIEAEAGRPFVVGIAGSVAVGKTTLAEGLRDHLTRTVELLTTDSFLFPNDVLAARGLSMRKGFPESYNEPRLRAALEAVRADREVRVPVYSHETYDIAPGEERLIVPPTALVLEGVNALRFRALLDYGIYVDAPVDAIETWYLDRVVSMVAGAPPGSFYEGWAGMTDSEIVAFARTGWDSINRVNLVEHIEPTARLADLVVRLGTEHELVSLGPPDAVEEPQPV